MLSKFHVISDCLSSGCRFTWIVTNLLPQTHQIDADDDNGNATCQSLLISSAAQRSSVNAPFYGVVYHVGDFG